MKNLKARAFTLLELLVVIAIIGILAALSVPAFQNFGKSSTNISASRQMLDAVARARQLAISQRATVFMVFVPTNFWDIPGTMNLNTVWFNALTNTQKTVATNLCSDQLSGYTFIAYGANGDQAGQHAWHYLAAWQSLPEGAFVALQKFVGPNTIHDAISGASYAIALFRYTNNIPFPAESASSGVWLPYLAFNYLGQLVSEVNGSGSYDDAYIPLARGSVLPASNPNTKALQFDSPDVMEVPPGNSTNSAYNIIHINWLTGRAVLEYHKMQP